MSSNLLKGYIAFCGTRGVPANYGGFETAVDEISFRFVEKGLPVDVFCRSSSIRTNAGCDKGRRLVFVNGSKSRQLDTFVSSIQTGFYLLRNRQKYAHVFWFNNANLPGILLTLLAGIPTTVNTDGLEWRRKKWSLPFKLYYFLASALISLLCKRLVSDSISIQKYYKKVFKKDTIFIPYGGPLLPEVSLMDQENCLKQYGLEPGKFFLQITRFEPDNYPLEVAKAFGESGLAGQGFRHVVVGYKDSTPYSETLKNLSGRNGVLVLPATYDPDTLFTLRKNCYCYVHGNSVGGTNPALLEAMSTSPRILAIDCVFSHETLGELGHYFQPDNIAEALLKTRFAPDLSTQLSSRVQMNYQWDAVAKAYFEVVEGIEPVYRVV